MTATATRPAPRAQQQGNGPSLEDVIASTTIEMRPELLQMKMENETIMSECRVRPRDMGGIRSALSSLLKEFPDFGAEAIYHKPVGKEEGSEQQKYADGLSIRAAEALAEAYGYNRVRADATPLDEARVKIDATFTDFQTGRIWQDGGIVSRFYTRRGGGKASHSDDRFYNVVIKAEKSKYLREVILRSVNPALKAWFEAECRKVAGELLTDKAVNEIITKFRETHGVTQQQIEKTIGKPVSMGWTKSDRICLQGLWNAIKEGETTAAEAFGNGEEQKPAAPTGPVTGAALTGGDKAQKELVK